ncbi:MAG TPA: exosortase-associated EpsI family protein [Devosia sp.]
MHDRNPATIPQRPAPQFVRAGYVFGLTLITVLICFLVPAPKTGGEAGVVMELPDKIGELYGHDQAVSEAELYILPKDTTFARKTYGPAGAEGPERILCSIILSGAERRSIHRPERCLPSQGWRIDATHTETVPLASGRNLDVTALLLEKPVVLQNGARVMRRQYFLYWFVGKGVTTPYQTTRILMTYWDMLVHRINQRWAYVIVAKDITQSWDPNGESPEQTLTELKDFIHVAVPSFMKSEMPADQGKG